MLNLKFKTKRDIIQGCLLILVGFLVGMYGSSHDADRKLLSIEDTNGGGMRKVNKKAEFMMSDMPKQLAIANNNQLSLYESTMRNCLGVTCFDQKVSTTKGLVARVGLLGIEKSGREVIMKILQESINSNPSIHLIEDMHVPPYGYGKNHGWSSIIRISRGLMEHAYSIIGPTNSDPEIMRNQVRQIVRWHCRLSHVAAHTRQLTVFTEDILTRPVVEIEKIATYMGYPSDRPRIISAIEKYGPALRAALVSQEIPNEMYSAGLSALQDELTSTKGLTKWPCKNFRELDNRGLPLKSSQLAANCSAAYVTCSVPYDIRGG